MVMKKFGKGKLHSGSKSGPVVKSHAQAVAIMLSEKDAEDETGSADRKKRKTPTRRKP
jgi:hypothetical protein